MMHIRDNQQLIALFKRHIQIRDRDFSIPHHPAYHQMVTILASNDVVERLPEHGRILNLASESESV